MLKCYHLSEADLTAVCSFQSILTRTGAVYRGLNSPHPNPSAENKLHIYRRIKRWNGTFPTTGLNTTGVKNDANLTAVAKRSHMVAPKVLSTSLFCSKCLGVLWFFGRKIIVTKQRGVYWRAGGVLAAFCFLSKLHRVGANFVKYWCSVYLTGKKENRCQGIICKKNATCGRYSGPRLQDFSASY